MPSPFSLSKPSSFKGGAFRLSRVWDASLGLDAGGKARSKLAMFDAVRVEQQRTFSKTKIIRAKINRVRFIFQLASPHVIHMETV